MKLIINLRLTFFLLFCTIISHRTSCQTIESVAEGPDCRCRCLLTSKEGQLCGDGYTRETVYIVETIPVGSDCRCSCSTPTPTGCLQSGWERLMSKDMASNREDLVGLKVEGLHRSITKLVKELSQLDKTLLRSISKPKVKEKASLSNVSASLTIIDEAKVTDDISENKPRVNSAEIITRPNFQTTTSHDITVVPALEPVNNGDGRDEASSSSDKQPKSEEVKERLNKERSLKMDSSDQDELETTAASQIDTNLHMVTVDPRNTTSGVPSTQSPEIGAASYEQTTKSASVLLTPALQKTAIKSDILVRPRIQFQPYRSEQKEPDDKDTTPEKTDTGYDYSYEYDELDGPITIKNTKVASPTHKAANALSISALTTASTQTLSTKYDRLDDPLSEYEYDYDYEKKFSTSTTTIKTATTVLGSDPCGTLYRVSPPKLLSKFGRKQGAWLRDSAKMKQGVQSPGKIYVANFYFGNTLLEFDDIIGMRQLIYRNTYELPHKWIGTGHVVYNGSFYYNRAFSTSLIKYDLSGRFVSAWSRLSNAVYQTWGALNWRGHSFVHLSADETGLWVIYPSRDPFDSLSKFTYIVSKISPVDLEVLESYNTKLRRPPSHFFMICGILYSTEGHKSGRASVTDAFDTKTLAKRSLYLEIENLFSYTVQFSYNPADKKIYAWDNGRQVEYNVELTY